MTQEFSSSDQAPESGHGGAKPNLAKANLQVWLKNGCSATNGFHLQTSNLGNQGMSLR